LWIYGANFIPRNPEIPDDVQVISIQSHNILAGNHDTETIVSIIQGFDADIVVMQEVTHLMAAAFESRLSEDYPYQALHPQNIGVQGMAVLSRYPILEDTYWKYEWVPTPLAHQRSVLQITETDSIVLYNSHPTHPGMNYSTFNPSWRSREIADVLERTFREELPVLLVGDFNLPDLSEDYQHVTENYTDAFRESGYGMGWTFGMIPNNPPFLRLDYIFITDDFTPISSRVGDSAGGSDHYPLFAEIGLISSNNP
jgi:endonuclease/exonuclease/phosphatase (EEP) superfamily protein YafD